MITETHELVGRTVEHEDGGLGVVTRVDIGSRSNCVIGVRVKRQGHLISTPLGPFVTTYYSHWFRDQFTPISTNNGTEGA